VVLTARDLARVLPSTWQENIQNGLTWTWPEFLASIQDPKQGSVNAAAAFWMRFDLEKVLSTWAAELTPERVHVVILPPAGAPSATLLERFAAAVGVDASVLEEAAPQVQSNAALGHTEVEALRRLNLKLGAELNERQYARAVVQAVIPALEARPASERVAIPPQDRPWLEKTSAELVSYLRAGAFEVIGDVDDLVPSSAPSATESAVESAETSSRSTVDESALTEPLLDALAAVCTTYAHRWWKNRPQEKEASGDSSVRLGSAARAASYKAKAQVLDKAEHNRALKWVTLAYLRRRK
jgi:hypothetical protein